MFCPECGAENPENAKFCGNCRCQLVIVPDVQKSKQNGNVIEVDGESEPVTDLMKYGIFAGTLLIPFIGFIMGIIYLSQGETENKKSVGKFWLLTSIAVFVLYLIFSEEF